MYYYDFQVLQKSSSLTDRNMDSLQKESTRLQEHSRSAWKCWLWIMLAVVMVIFISKYMYRTGHTFLYINIGKHFRKTRNIDTFCYLCVQQMRYYQHDPSTCKKIKGSTCTLTKINNDHDQINDEFLKHPYNLVLGDKLDRLSIQLCFFLFQIWCCS